MKDYKELRELIKEYNFNADDLREVIESGGDIYSNDDCYRLICDDDIDTIMQDELASDEYMLGCFNAWFLAVILGTSTEAIEAMQEKDAYEGIGKMIIANDLLEKLQREYVSADGYGHHFSSYDGCDTEIDIDGTTYHLFRLN